MKHSRHKVLLIMECTIGGTRRHIRELAIGLARRGHKVTALCSAERDPGFRGDLREMAGAGVEVAELPMVRPISPWTDFKQFLFLWRFLRARSFDVVHTHSSKAGVLGRLAALFAGHHAVVHTPHTFAFSFKGHFGGVKSRLFADIERFLGRWTSRLVNVSDSERREAQRFRITSPERMTVVENGIDPWPYRWAEAPEPGEGLFPEGGPAPVVLTVGLLNEAKGHDVLIRAFPGLLKRVPGAGLAIVGEGELRPRLEALIHELGLDGRVLLKGYREDVPSLLKEADLFVLPSLWEGMPYVLLEAMAAGLPVVATDVNGSRDIVEHGRTGLLVTPADAGALEGACVQILEDPARGASMAREGLKRVMERYTLEGMIDRIEGIYDHVTADRGRDGVA